MIYKYRQTYRFNAQYSICLIFKYFSDDVWPFRWVKVSELVLLMLTII